MSSPSVSIVMPTFKRPAQIAASIRSLLDGAFQDFELLVRDDGDGVDATERVVREASGDDVRVHYWRNCSSLGMPENINAGILGARGKYIAICHDHDIYYPDFLQVMVGALEDVHDALFVHCAVDVVSQSGAPAGRHVGAWPPQMSGMDWLRIMLRTVDCPVCALTVVRRDAHQRFGLYDPRFGFVADVEMWMRLARSGDVAYIARPLIALRQREPGHFASEGASDLLRLIEEIHREYLAVAYRGWRLAAEHSRLWLQVTRKLARARLGAICRHWKRRRLGT